MEFLKSKRIVTLFVSILSLFLTQTGNYPPETVELLSNSVLLLGGLAIGMFTLEDVARVFKGTKNYPEFEAALKNAKKEMVETFTEFLQNIKEEGEKGAE